MTLHVLLIVELYFTSPWKHLFIQLISQHHRHSVRQIRSIPWHVDIEHFEFTVKELSFIREHLGTSFLQVKENMVELMVVIGTLTSRDKGEHSVDLAAQALVVIELGETEKGPRDVSLHEPFEVAWTDTFGELAF